MTLIIYTHPCPQHPHTNKRILEQTETLGDVEIRSFYQLYPDFNIDVAAGQAALTRAGLVIQQHPMQWYNVLPLLKLWMGKVLAHSWARSHNGIALYSESLMQAVTTGDGESHSDIDSFPDFPVLAQPLQATAPYCGVRQLSPFAMRCAFICDNGTPQAQARHCRQRLTDWQGAHQNGQSYADTSAGLSGRRGTGCTHHRSPGAGVGTGLSDRWLYYRPVGAAADD